MKLTDRFRADPGFSRHSFRYVKDLPFYELDSVSADELWSMQALLDTECFAGRSKEIALDAFIESFESEIGRAYENEDLDDRIEEDFQSSLAQMVYRKNLGHFQEPYCCDLWEEWYKYGTDAGRVYAEGLELDYGEWLAGA